jgi:hypothetical protein
MKTICLLALAGLAFAASTGFGQTSIAITNPSFETDSAPAGSFTFISGGAGTGTLTGWTASSTAQDPIIDLQRPNGTGQDGTGATPVAGQDATQIVEIYNLNSFTAGAGNVHQNLLTSFVAGDTYMLTADAGVKTGQTPQAGDVFFIANSSGSVLESTPITGITPGAFSQFTVTLASDGTFGDTGPIQIGFSSPSSNDGSYMEIDNFALTVTPTVPEPGPIVIAAFGGFGLLGLARRRRA